MWIFMQKMLVFLYVLVRKSTSQLTISILQRLTREYLDYKKGMYPPNYYSIQVLVMSKKPVLRGQSPVHMV